MLRKVPPLESLEIFVAAARRESFRAVARDLALSPSAVSRRIAGLEAFLGTTLFHRNERGQRLNDEGRRYFEQIAPAIGQIQAATDRLGEQAPGRLCIATSHSIGGGWLMPRLARLRHGEGIDLEILPTRDFEVLRSGGASLGFWGGMAKPDDMEAEPIIKPALVPVAAPRLADGRSPPRVESELSNYDLLSVTTPSGLWDRWLSSPSIRRPQVREFATLQLMYEAAAAGLGVTLAMPMAAEPFLRTAKLACCFPTARTVGASYSVYWPRKRSALSCTERRFVRWLQGEVDSSIREFMTALSLPLGDAENETH